MQDVQDREVVTKLFDTIAPRFASRPGGYTRLLRIGFRRGDSAEMAQVELVGSEFDPKAKAEGEAAEAAKPKTKGVGGRLRAAAERLRGKKDDKEAAPEGVDQAVERRDAQVHDAEKSRWQLDGAAVNELVWAFQILAAAQFFLTGLDKLGDAPADGAAVQRGRVRSVVPVFHRRRRGCRARCCC